MKTKYIQITAGKGPVECQYVVAKVLSHFLENIRNEGAIATVIHRTEGFENGTLQSATVQIENVKNNQLIENWLGTILWIEKSPYRKLHKRKNWFIGIYEIKDLEIKTLKEKDISYQTMRSSGAGGQHVNKVSSAVRAIHIPTGISVVSQDSRSQHQNKKLARERLALKVNEENLIQIKNQMSEKWEQHLDLERGNPVKTFNGTDFKKKKEIKSFKKIRNQLKQDLRNNQQEN